MALLILFNKPYGVLSQFSGDGAHPTLKPFIELPNVYPAGRLDRDSEGLLLLTDDGQLQHHIAHPRHKQQKSYWVQVEGEPTTEAIGTLQQGVLLSDGMTLPAQVRRIDEPALWPRQPPIRWRANKPTHWLEITIREGRNRQVRRMTAAVGLPTLRLVRWRIGDWTLDGLAPGEWRSVQIESPAQTAPHPRRVPASRPQRAPKRSPRG